jgi:hypothetical protein
MKKLISFILLIFLIGISNQMEYRRYIDRKGIQYHNEKYNSCIFQFRDKSKCDLFLKETEKMNKCYDKYEEKIKVVYGAKKKTNCVRNCVVPPKKIECEKFVELCKRRTRSVIYNCKTIKNEKYNKKICKKFKKEVIPLFKMAERECNKNTKEQKLFMERRELEKKKISLKRNNFELEREKLEKEEIEIEKRQEKELLDLVLKDLKNEEEKKKLINDDDDELKKYVEELMK